MDAAAQIEHAFGLPRGTCLRMQLADLSVKIDALAMQFKQPSPDAALARDRANMERLFSLPPGALARRL